MQKIFELINKKEKCIMGLMSGTSGDGLDIALIGISGSGLSTRFNLIKSSSVPYNDVQKSEIMQMVQSGKANAKDLSQLNFYLAHLWAEMIDTFLSANNLSKDDVNLIGSHGHTIWHQPRPEKFIDKDMRSTLQMGDPSALAQLTGIPVVGDFRLADVALGGQGAPLIPFFDWVYFSQFKKNMLSLNIGGIANFTFIPADGDFEKVRAFDTGPGNMLIDQAASKLFDRPFDDRGKLARSGKLSEKLLNEIKRMDNFPGMEPPKSTGREMYGTAFFERIIYEANRLKIMGVDILHTLTYYTALTILENYRQFIRHPLQGLVVSGGGAKNTFLMDLLAGLFEECAVSTTAEYDLDDDFKEAIGFAVLANEAIHGNSANVPQVTGARKAAVLGKIILV